MTSNTTNSISKDSAKHAASGTSKDYQKSIIRGADQLAREIDREVLETLERTAKDPHRKRRYYSSARVVPTWGECTTEDIREAIKTFEGVDMNKALKRINGGSYD